MSDGLHTYVMVIACMAKVTRLQFTSSAPRTAVDCGVYTDSNFAPMQINGTGLALAYSIKTFAQAVHTYKFFAKCYQC